MHETGRPAERTHDHSSSETQAPADGDGVVAGSPASALAPDDFRIGSTTASGRATGIRRPGWVRGLFRTSVTDRVSSNRGAAGTVGAFHIFIDMWSIQDDRVLVSGWAWHETKSVTNASLQWRTTGHAETHDIAYGRRRADVGEKFGYAQAFLSGFEANVPLSSRDDGSVVLFFRLDDGEVISVTLNRTAFRRRTLKKGARALPGAFAAKIKSVSRTQLVRSVTSARGDPGVLEALHFCIDGVTLRDDWLTIFGWVWHQDDAVIAVRLRSRKRSSDERVEDGLRIRRPDVAAYFETSAAESSGFECRIHFDGPLEGDPILEIELASGDVINLTLNRLSWQSRRFAILAQNVAGSAWSWLNTCARRLGVLGEGGHYTAVPVEGGQMVLSKTFRMSLDHGEIGGGVVSLAGWAWHRARQIQRGTLIVRTNSVTIRKRLHYGIEREDVARVFPFPGAERSGFGLDALLAIDPPTSAQLVFELAGGAIVRVVLDPVRLSFGSGDGLQTQGAVDAASQGLRGRFASIPILAVAGRTLSALFRGLCRPTIRAISSDRGAAGTADLLTVRIERALATRSGGHVSGYLFHKSKSVAKAVLQADDGFELVRVPVRHRLPRPDLNDTSVPPRSGFTINLKQGLKLGRSPSLGVLLEDGEVFRLDLNGPALVANPLRRIITLWPGLIWRRFKRAFLAAVRLIRPPIVVGRTSNQRERLTSSQPYFHVDRARIGPHGAEIDGWVFDPQTKLVKAAAVFEAGGQSTRRAVSTRKPRPELVRKLRSNDAATCGFEVAVEGLSAAPDTVIFGALFENGEEVRLTLDGAALRRHRYWAILDRLVSPIVNLRHALRTQLFDVLDAPLVVGVDRSASSARNFDDFHCFVDQADLVGRQLSVLGWAFDEAHGIESGTICLESRRGVDEHEIRTGESRRDVGATFRSQAAAKSGLSGTVVLPVRKPTALYLKIKLANGDEVRVALDHRMLWLRAARSWFRELPSRLQARTGLGRRRTIAATGKPVVTGISSNQGRSGSADRFHIYVEHAMRTRDRVTLRGWAFHELSPTLQVGLSTEKSAAGALVPVNYGQSREDVRSNRGFDNARRSGFRVTAPLGKRTGDPLTLVFFLESREHISVSLDPHRFEASRLPQGLARARKILQAQGIGRLDVAAVLARHLVRGNFGALRAYASVLGGVVGAPEETPPAPDLATAAHRFLVSPPPISDLDDEVDVIIPVYNGMEYLPPLFDSLFRNTTSPYRLIVIDDCSPDPNVWPFLQSRLANRPQVILLRNETNLGFVGTVNRAAGLSRNHVALLNADIELPPRWIERLMEPILSNPRVASTTPFSNSATICSFPTVNIDQEPLAGLGVDALDAQFRYVDAEHEAIELPTGIGFCMGINRAVIERIGMFDAATFGRGYGEENDWCMRAQALGYRDQLVPNLYIYHKHGGSFDSDLKQRLQRENALKLVRRHPIYPFLVDRHVQADPMAPLRAFLVMLAGARASEEAPLMIIDHVMGGGANSYRRAMVDREGQSGRRAVFVLAFDATFGEMSLEVHYGGHDAKLLVGRAADLEALGEHLSLSEIFYNGLVSYEHPREILDVACRLKVQTGARMTIAVHDYFPICPSFNLLNESGAFCGVPDLEVCRICLPKNRFAGMLSHEDIDAWRRDWQQAFGLADNVLCFSQSSRDLVLRAYKVPEDRITIRPHVSSFEPKRLPQVDHTRPLTIGVIGAIDYQKGRDVIVAMATRIDALELPIRIAVIGVLNDPPERACLTVSGRYQVDDLPDLIEKQGISICFLPSIVPETFSYVTEEAMQMQMPLCCFDVGAPAERVAVYDKGKVLSDMDPVAALDEIIDFSQSLADASFVEA